MMNNFVVMQCLYDVYVMIISYYGDVKYGRQGYKCEKGVGIYVDGRYQCGIVCYEQWNIN